MYAHCAGWYIKYIVIPWYYLYTVLIPVDLFLYCNIVIPQYSLRFGRYFKQYIPGISNFALKWCSESFKTIAVIAMITSMKSVPAQSNTLLDEMRECCQNGYIVGCEF